MVEYFGWSYLEIVVRNGHGQAIAQLRLRRFVNRDRYLAVTEGLLGIGRSSHVCVCANGL